MILRMIMDYILKNKDKNVLSFSSEETLTEDGDIETSLYNIKIFDEKILPLSMRDKGIKRGLTHWIEKRKIPQGRQFVKNILETLGVNEKILMGYINVSYGLSLNDSFWVIPADKDYKWKDYNLYTNDFDKGLQLAAFGGRVSQRSKSRSPEFTTNGMLPKCWHRDDEEKIYLYKASYINEAPSEYYNYQIAKKMGLPAIPYGILKFHDRIVSSCPLFTNEKVGYVPIDVLVPKDIDVKTNKFLRVCSEIYGQETFEDLMVFDALIGNIDRHTGNFGMLIDNNTLEILAPAPIFDNGLGIIGRHFKKELSIKDDWENSRSAFGLGLNAQLKLYLRPRHMDMLERLVDFKFERNALCDIPESILCEYEDMLQEKLDEALSKGPKLS